MKRLLLFVFLLLGYVSTAAAVDAEEEEKGRDPFELLGGGSFIDEDVEVEEEGREEAMISSIRRLYQGYSRWTYKPKVETFKYKFVTNNRSIVCRKTAVLRQINIEKGI